MFDKINPRYLKLAGLCIGVIGAGIASVTQRKEIEAAVEKAMNEKALAAIDVAVEAALNNRAASPTSSN